MRNQKSIKLEKVKVNDGFWSSVQALVRDVVIPYQLEVMEDNVPGVEKSHVIQNFRIAAGEADGEHYGFIFQDSDLAKWLEAVAYSLTIHPDKELEKQADELIALVGRAQESDGYLNTFFTIKEPDRKWTNLQEAHEMYVSGHMIEAAVAYYQATGKEELLNIMRRNADLICSRFGHDKIRGFPGHQEIELALLRLYEVTGEESYLETAKYFLDERGTEPSYFLEEAKTRGWFRYNNATEERTYTQNHAPVREQDKAIGHSVRAMYMYTAMAALAAEKNDAGLKKACDTLWENVTQTQMYITGGLGSTNHGEAFTVDYDLPNATTYSETCASIGMCFFAGRMLEIKPSGQYADVLERMLYNAVLASMQFDGKRFFYVNPMEVVPGISGVVQVNKHVKPSRPEWYACACCPPNLARLLMSIGQYAWGESDDTVYAHLFLGGSAAFNTAGGVTIECESNYPRNCDISYTVNPVNGKADFCFAVHIPTWCKEVTYSLNGKTVEAELKDGYAYFSRTWQPGDKLEINAELPILRIYSNLAVGINAGQVCLQRGPVVYCFEETDNSAPLAALRLPSDAEINEAEIDIGTKKGILALTAKGIKETGDNNLYSEQKPKSEPVNLLAVPYYTWGNRALGAMRVWIRE